MNFTLPIDIPRHPQPIRYPDSILLVGSCFTEHIAGRLAAHKFRTMQNPHGILFNPMSVAQSLDSYLSHRLYTEDDLFYLLETWNSWAHHSRFSHTDKAETLAGINASQQAASAFIQQADWIIITLGSAFQYFLKEKDLPVANNHRAPAQWLEKRLLTTEAMQDALSGTLDHLLTINPGVQVLFTISPVRHVRDGVVDNNRSKARLIEATHYLCNKYANCRYFPAYEIVIDVLRDYRFYDTDLVHPNYAATETVWDYFTKACIAPETLPLMQAVKDITIAKAHRPRFPETAAHQKFLSSYAEKTTALMQQYPLLDLSEELRYFTRG